MTYEDLLNDKTREHAITRSLEIIGEAVKNIPDEVKRTHPEIQWKFMAGLRDKIIHGYFSINYDIVWDVITRKLPEIEPRIRAIHNGMNEDD